MCFGLGDDRSRFLLRDLEFDKSLDLRISRLTLLERLAGVDARVDEVLSGAEISHSRSVCLDSGDVRVLR